MEAKLAKWSGRFFTAKDVNIGENVLCNLCYVQAFSTSNGLRFKYAPFGIYNIDTLQSRLKEIYPHGLHRRDLMNAYKFVNFDINAISREDDFFLSHDVVFYAPHKKNLHTQTLTEFREALRNIQPRIVHFKKNNKPRERKKRQPTPKLTIHAPRAESGKPFKRGPGRPRKHAQNPMELNTNVSFNIDVQTHASNASQIKVHPKKRNPAKEKKSGRGRGRPRNVVVQPHEKTASLMSMLTTHDKMQPICTQ